MELIWCQRLFKNQSCNTELETTVNALCEIKSEPATLVWLN